MMTESIAGLPARWAAALGDDLIWVLVPGESRTRSHGAGAEGFLWLIDLAREMLTEARLPGNHLLIRTEHAQCLVLHDGFAPRLALGVTPQCELASLIAAGLDGMTLRGHKNR